ncbi:MAG: hypothetical protein AB7O73_00510 [Bacteroidia bacterium]
MKNFTYISAFFFITFLMSCTEKPVAVENNEKVIASVGSSKLYETDFNNNLIRGYTREDSILFANKTIENWAIDELFYNEANKTLNEGEKGIDKEVEAYRKSLINHIYETKLIESNLDTVVSDEEIESYYNQYLDNFILKDNIVKVNYFKIPSQSKEIGKMKKFIHSTDSKSKQQLESLCQEHAENYFLNDSIWLLIYDLQREIPSLKEQLDYNTYKGRVIEFNDDNSFYYLQIKDVKTKNTLSPLGYEKANIKTFILNARKVKLISTYKTQLLEKAKKEKAFKIN